MGDCSTSDIAANIATSSSMLTGLDADTNVAPDIRREAAGALCDSEAFWARLLRDAVALRATDIHFNDSMIQLRIDTDLQDYMKLEPREYAAHLLHLLPRELLRARLDGDHGAADFARTIAGERLRVNLYRCVRGYAAAVRILPRKSLRWEDIGLTDEIVEVVRGSQQGLILVTGPTGSGKSTTVCSLLEMLNENFPYKIVTIEDPIEYIFTRKKANISQREVGEHAQSFADALRSSLRQDPDVIFVGEIRDYDTARVALHAAETGHLVFATLHTKRVYNTITTLIEFASADKQSEMRNRIANNLLLVMCQRLLPAVGGGLVCAREVLIQCPSASSYISSGKEKSLINVMQTGRAKGMIDWNSAIAYLERENVIDHSTALLYRDNSDDIS